ncbi:MAG: hypothetical protein V1826_00525 [bacterium]
MGTLFIRHAALEWVFYLGVCATLIVAVVMVAVRIICWARHRCFLHGEERAELAYQAGWSDEAVKAQRRTLQPRQFSPPELLEAMGCDGPGRASEFGDRHCIAEEDTPPDGGRCGEKSPETGSGLMLMGDHPAAYYAYSVGLRLGRRHRYSMPARLRSGRRKPLVVVAFSAQAALEWVMQRYGVGRRHLSVCRKRLREIS